MYKIKTCILSCFFGLYLSLIDSDPSLPGRIRVKLFICSRSYVGLTKSLNWKPGRNLLSESFIFAKQSFSFLFGKVRKLSYWEHKVKLLNISVDTWKILNMRTLIHASLKFFSFCIVLKLTNFKNTKKWEKHICFKESCNVKTEKEEGMRCFYLLTPTCYND